MQSLSQRRFLRTHNFELLENGISFQSKSLFNSISTEIPFENISIRLIEQRKFQWQLLVATFFFLIVLLLKIYFITFDDNTDYGVTLFVFFLFISCATLAYQSNKRSYLIPVDELGYIEFFADSPNNVKVKEFIDNLRTVLRKYLMHKYAKPNPLMPVDQHILHLNWLKSRDIISIDEYEKLVEMISPPPQQEIGFKPSHF